MQNTLQCLYLMSSWSFSFTESCCRACWVPLGICDHTVTLQKVFCSLPQGAHSAHSSIITSKWLQKSLQYCHCWEHFTKASDNNNIHICPACWLQIFINIQRVVNALQISYNLTPCNLLLWELTMHHSAIASNWEFCSILWSSGDECQDSALHKTNWFFCFVFFLYRSLFWRWWLRAEMLLNSLSGYLFVLLPGKLSHIHCGKTKVYCSTHSN